MPVRKPDELPRSYLNDYYGNWWRRLTKRRPDTSLRGSCFQCGKRGVLGYDLVHRGWARTTNLFCDDCCEQDE